MTTHYNKDAETTHDRTGSQPSMTRIIIQGENTIH